MKYLKGVEVVGEYADGSRDRWVLEGSLEEIKEKAQQIVKERNLVDYWINGGQIVNLLCKIGLHKLGSEKRCWVPVERNRRILLKHKVCKRCGEVVPVN